MVLVYYKTVLHTSSLIYDTIIIWHPGISEDGHTQEFEILMPAKILEASHKEISSSPFVSVTGRVWFCGHLEYSITSKVHKF
jgi:hypothetical protein